MDSTESCRILTVSSSLAQAVSFVRRVQELQKSTPSLPDTPDVSQSSISIPWTISNRYYTANVHFALHPIHGLSPHRLRNIPAVIFVWAQGEPYRHHVERLAQDLAGYEPEVSLAVKIPHTTSPAEQEVEDNAEIDAFISSHGFEYINATEDAGTGEDEADAYSEDIPHLPRVLDALSTIMWPSMQSQNVKQKIGKSDRERDLLDWANNSQDYSMAAVEDLVTSSSDALAGARNMRQEMEELARWLEVDEPLSKDPWRSASVSGALSTSPIAMEPGAPSTAEIGFEDDFTVFVSAPAISSTKAEETPQSVPDELPDDVHDTLMPPSELYRSLGSVSDFGDEGEEGKKVESDDDLPTEEEIRATSSRIFGGQPLSQTDTAGPISPSAETPKATSEAFTFEPVPPEDDETYEMAPFDLTRVLGALEEMKAEIAGIDDEGARRKAAARVALGLVYGLEE